MKRKELTKIFMMILNWKKKLVPMVYKKYFCAISVKFIVHSREKGNNVLIENLSLWDIGGIQALNRYLFSYYLDAGLIAKRHFNLVQPFQCYICWMWYMSGNCLIWRENVTLKAHTQTKIIKKSMILFWLPYMTIWCKHVHRLELQKFLDFSAAHSPARLDIGLETTFLISYFGQPCKK